MRGLDSEQPNLQAMLAWVADSRQPPDQLERALGDVWVWLLVRGHLRQSATLWQQIVSLLAQEPAAGGDRMARAWLLAGGWMNAGEFTKAIAAVDEVVPDGQRAEKPSRIAMLLMARGIACADIAHDQARADFAEALAVARPAGDPLVLAYVQIHYGARLGLDGDLDQARVLHEQALTIARSIGDENLRAEAHYVLAVDAMTVSDTRSAAPQLAAAVLHYRSIDHLEGLTRCVGALSELALQSGDPLTGLLDGGAIFMQSPYTDPAEVWKRIPPHHQKTIKQKKIRVFFVDMVKIAREVASVADLQMRMQGIVLLGAFLKLTPYARESDMTDDQVYAGVEKALTKYFGKRGGRVVQDNMTCVKRGYSEMQEIPRSMMG